MTPEQLATNSEPSLAFETVMCWNKCRLDDRRARPFGEAIELYLLS